MGSMHINRRWRMFSAMRCWRVSAHISALAAFDGAGYRLTSISRFLDPMCDACVAAMGAAGCLDCVHGSSGGNQLFNDVMVQIQSKRRTMIALLQMQLYVKGQNSTVKVNLNQS